ncbi:MAG: type II CAAX endopeptidase family protein, partial [Chloroflexota bacterium]
VSNLLFAWLPAYVRLILNQALFILLPTLLYLRWAKLPVRPTVGWRWPGGMTAVYSFLIGAGLYPLAIYTVLFFQSLLGYSLPDMPEMIPATPLEALLALVALAVMAPICEEFLFRGVIQPAYAHHGPLRTILFVGLLFVIFHLSLLQGLSIIPLALVLGFVYWRTNSLPAAMLTHFGVNLMAVLVLTSGVWIAAAETVILAWPTALIGLLAALFSVVMLVRTTQPEPPPSAPAIRHSRLAQSWPLLPIFLVFVIFIGVEVFIGRSPALMASPIALNELPWHEPQTWQYEISNIIDDPIGHATCTLDPETAVVTLRCQQEQAGYEVQVGQSYWSSIDFVGERTVQWQRDSYAPLTDRGDHDLRQMRWAVERDQVLVEVAYEGMETRSSMEPLPLLAQDVLVTSGGSWPWQLTALTFEAGSTARLVHINPDVWRPATQDMGPVVETMVVKIVGLEEIETPTGPQDAWRVEVGSREVAWYDTVVPHTLLRYHNGMETWTLTE